jgi:hypothetical protein
MPLPTNPFAKLVASVSQAIAPVSNSVSSGFSGIGNEVSKLKLDQKIGELGGELGSGLNGATSALKNGFSDLGGAASKFNSALTDAAGLTSLAKNTSIIKADISSSLSKLGGGSLAGGISQLAGSLSKAAGTLNDILSLRRGLNIPSGAEYVRRQGAAIRLNPGSKDDWRVRIQAPWRTLDSGMFKVLEATGGVVFPFLPQITVSTKANYQTVETVHSNYPYYSYKNSTVDDIQISCEFPAETETDAAYWIAATTFFKTATKMFFGQGENAGNPPIICNLTGYGASVFDRIPIIITAFSVDLKDDVNYVRCNVFGTNTWVPILSTITVTCVPIYSRESLRKFDLKTYASGKMVSDQGVGYL